MPRRKNQLSITAVIVAVLFGVGVDIKPVDAAVRNFGRRGFEYSPIPISWRPKKEDKTTWPKVNCPSTDVDECPSVLNLGVTVQPPAQRIGKEMRVAFLLLKNEVDKHDATFIAKVNTLTERSIPLKMLEIRNLEQQIRTTNPLNAAYLKLRKRRPLVSELKKMKAERRGARDLIITNNWIINEAYPRSVVHDAVCHDTGCVIDMGGLDGGRKKSARGLRRRFYAVRVVVSFENKREGTSGCPLYLSATDCVRARGRLLDLRQAYAGVGPQASAGAARRARF